MTEKEEIRQKLHDTFVRGNCHIGIWTQIEHFEFGTPREPIESFYSRIERVDERDSICLAKFKPVHIMLRYPN